VAGRFSKHHKRCIGEEDNKWNKQVIAKLLIQIISISVILVDAILFIVISLLREDPLSTGILDMFFLKISDHSSLKLREFISLNRSARKRIYACKWTNMVYQLQMAMFWSILGPRINLIGRKRS
jgi:hypothetical protein